MKGNLQLLWAAVALWLVTLGAGPAGGQEPRTWVSADGKYKTQATLVELTEETVTLRRADGKVVTVPRNKLSRADREFLNKITRPTPAPNDDAFVIEGLLSIESPSDDYTWKPTQQYDASGVKVRVLVCSTESSFDGATLVVEQRPRNTDAERTATIKGHYNALIESLEKSGFSDLKGTQPSLETPVPHVVAYAMTGKLPSGDPVHIRGASVFGKNAYALQVIAGDADTADALLSTIKTLHEF